MVTVIVTLLKLYMGFHHILRLGYLLLGLTNIYNKHLSGVITVCFHKGG